MSPLFSYVFLLPICILPIIGKCQSPFSGEQNEVNRSMMTIGKAWSEKNLDTLEKYIDDNYQHTDTQGRMLDKKSWFRLVADGKEKNPVIVFQDTQIQVLGDIAIATGISIFIVNDHAKNNANSAKANKIRYTQVLKKENGIWKRFVFQGTSIP